MAELTNSSKRADSTFSDPTSDELSEAGVRGTAWIAFQSIFINLASLAVFIVLGRLLDPEAFGLVASASVVVIFLRILVDGGVSRHLVQRETLTEDLVNSAFWTAVVTGIILTLVVIAAAPLLARLFHQPALTNVVRALSCVIIFASLDRTQSALLDRRMAFRIQAVRGSIAALCSAAVAIAAAFAGWGVWALVLQTITFEVVNLICLWSLSGWRPRFSFARHHLRELLPSGTRYVSIFIVQYLNLNVDNLLIGIFLGPVALGFYVVAYRILIVSNEVLVTTVNRVGVAAFSRLQRDADALRSACYTVAGLSAAIALPLYVGLALLSPEVIHLLFGSKWAQSAPVMQVLCIAGIMQALTSFTHPLVIALGKVRNELQWNLAACALFMVGFAASVHFGIVAVAWSIAVANAVFLPIRLMLIRRWAGVSLKSYFGRLVGPCAAVSLMAISVVGVGHVLRDQGLLVRFVSEVAAGAVVYLVALTVVDRRTANLLPRLLQGLYR